MPKIHVYADELGDAGPYSERSPIYSLSLLFLDEVSDRNKNLRILKSAIRKYGATTSSTAETSSAGRNPTRAFCGG